MSSNLEDYLTYTERERTALFSKCYGLHKEINFKIQNFVRYQNLESVISMSYPHSNPHYAKTGAHLDPCYACIQSSLLCVEVPRILTCCCEAIEQHGIIDGIYRLSGRAVLVQKLRFVLCCHILISYYVCTYIFT